MECEDLDLPRPDGAGEPGQLSNLDAIAPPVEAVQGGAGRGRADRGGDGPQQFLALPGRGDLTGGISSRQPGPQPDPSPLGELLGSGQQQLADAVQRVTLATSMAERGLLGPPAPLVDHRVGQPDGVEVVHHHPGVPKPGRQCVGVPAPGVQRDRADLGQPVNRSGTKPVIHRGPGAVGHHIQQPATLQVHQASDIPGRRHLGRLEEGGLIQAQRGHTLQTSSVIHQRAAVVAHRPHDGRPADAEVASDRRHRMGVLADPPASLGAGPLGQHRPRTDRRRPLGPGPHLAGRLTTAPEALVPAQHHRTATNGQVAHPDRAAAVKLGPDPTAHATNHGRRGLDDKLPLAAYDLGGEDLEAVQAQQPGSGRTTVLTHLGPPVLQTLDIRKLCEVPGPVLAALYRRQHHTAPRFMTKSRITSL